MLLESFKVDSPNVKYEADAIHSRYEYQTTEVEAPQGGEGVFKVKPVTNTYEFKTDTRVPKLGYVDMRGGG